MGIIKILDENVSNAIAAGEVVENPSSMIKELIENSLDAGSKFIQIDVKNGGLNVAITDDGCGMIKEDILMSIERHATSKIKNKEDLFKIKTYGFRGEALSSISAVSKMIISSRTSEMDMGIQINVLGGKITNLKEVQKNVGTHIEVKDLFFNTPARLKFLRKDSTEYLNIKDIVIRESLANPYVKFSLIIEGKEALKSSGNGIENVILEILGNNYLKNFQKFSFGYVGNSQLYRSNREAIYTFVNSRPVKSKLIENAVIDAYYTKLMKGKYPSALVFLEVDPDQIDINVHPSKKIVKFSNQSEIYTKIKESIEAIFSNNEDFISDGIEKNFVMNLDFHKENEEKFTREKKLENNILNIDDFKKENEIEQLQVTKKEENFVANSFNLFEEKEAGELNVKEEINLYTAKAENNKVNNENSNSLSIFEDFSKIKNIDFRVIGQLFDTFILVERKGFFEIYDQHIIHERVLYEKLKKEYYGKKIRKQNLLVPIRINLDVKEKQIALENLEIFSDFGFEIDDFEKNEILLRAVPAMDLKDSFENIIREILNNINKNKNVDIREDIIISMSCKGAIKANHKLTHEEMYSMVSKLHEVGEYTCPHGRPIIVKLTLNDLEKLFKRK